MIPSLFFPTGKEQIPKGTSRASSVSSQQPKGKLMSSPIVVRLADFNIYQVHFFKLVKLGLLCPWLLHNYDVKGQFWTPLKLTEVFSFIIGLHLYGPASALLKSVGISLLIFILDDNLSQSCFGSKFYCFPSPDIWNFMFL